MADIAAFHIGGFNVYWYGITTSIAIVLGILAAGWAAHLHREKFSRIVDILVFGIPAAMISSRLAFVFLHWNLYKENWLEIFALQHGGLSVYGAALGFIGVVFLYAYWHGLSFWLWLDILAPALLLGLATDQIGHFVFQANIGLPVTEDIAAHSRIIQYVEYAFRPSGFEGYEYFQPVALYQSLWLLVIFFIILVLSGIAARWNVFPKGNLFLLAGVLALSGRFGFGFWYLTTNPGVSLHFAQIVSLMGAAVCGGIFFWRQLQIRRRKRTFIFRG